MKIRQFISSAAFLSLAITLPLKADSFSGDAKVGSLGIGLESSFRINPYFSVTGSVNGFGLSAGTSNRNVDLHGKLRLLTAGASFGIHPFKNSFKVLAGIFYDGNQFKLDAMLKHNVTINGVTYTREQVGKSSLTLHYNRVSPFLGIGFDTPLCAESSWSFLGELGVLFQGSSKAKITREGNLRIYPDVRRYIKKQAEKSGDKFLLKYYPVISVGFKYTF